jgi:hypothetical protein
MTNCEPSKHSFKTVCVRKYKRVSHGHLNGKYFIKNEFFLQETYSSHLCNFMRTIEKNTL